MRARSTVCSSWTIEPWRASTRSTESGVSETGWILRPWAWARRTSKSTTEPQSLCPPEAAHYVPLRPPGMIGQPSSGLCPPRAGGSASPPPRSRPRFPAQNLGGLFCVCSLPGGARVAGPLRGQVVLFLLMRRELGLVAGGSSSVHNCSCATFSPFPICTGIDPGWHEAVASKPSADARSLPRPLRRGARQRACRCE
jgi:hypothetical protein